MFLMKIAEFVNQHGEPNEILNKAVNAAQSNITLPDIQPFSNADDGTDFEEWLERFQYSVECVAATMKEDVKCLILLSSLRQHILFLMTANEATHSKDRSSKVGLLTAYINSISLSKLVRASITINVTPINFLLDTGADVNVIDEKAFKALGHPLIEACGEEAVQFDGSRCKFLGKGIATFQFKEIQSA
ncbi:hypothetical protein GPALN_004214 [Globodera pallida]|nr:hypothetical protein GPALN_004214 [Globodera pallida]